MSTFYDSPNDYRNYLCHYGVKGMKWGVRHDKPSVAIKKRRMKKYGVSEKEYDEVKDAAKKKSGPIKAMTTLQGGLVGGMSGYGKARQLAANEGKRAFNEVFRDGISTSVKPINVNDIHVRGILDAGQPTGAYMRGSLTDLANRARTDAISRFMHNPVTIGGIGLSAAAGSAIGYTGGRILEEVIASNMMSEVGLRRDNRTYDDLRERTVRVKR